MDISALQNKIYAWIFSNILLIWSWLFDLANNNNFPILIPYFIFRIWRIMRYLSLQLFSSCNIWKYLIMHLIYLPSKRPLRFSSFDVIYLIKITWSIFSFFLRFCTIYIVNIYWITDKFRRVWINDLNYRQFIIWT